MCGRDGEEPFTRVKGGYIPLTLNCRTSLPGNGGARTVVKLPENRSTCTAKQLNAIDSLPQMLASEPMTTGRTQMAARGGKKLVMTRPANSDKPLARVEALHVS